MNALLQKLRAAQSLSRLARLEGKGRLSHHELHQRDTYIARLVAIGPPAVPQIMRKLAKVEASDPFSPFHLVLEQMGDPAVPYLAQAKHHDNSRLRHHAISILGRIGTPAAIRELEDETIDLMDKEVVDAALHEARHHPHQA